MKAELIQKEAAILTAGIEDWELEADLQDAFIEGALWAEKTIIDKAFKWLENDFEELTRLHLDDIVIDKFRKAMEGGEE